LAREPVTASHQYRPDAACSSSSRQLLITHSVNHSNTLSLITRSISRQSRACTDQSIP